MIIHTKINPNLGNSFYGHTIMNKRRHSDVKFCSFDEAKHLVNSPLFRSIEEYGKCFEV